ncbi:MAG: hypothetical protein HOZ81_32005 [Streptomyces sp.]|nr:hypothetical protein [Streptomyces sp.]NUS30574.1 hypothetical protein [Streptomyces sp.]
MRLAERGHRATVARAGKAEASLAELEEALSRARAELREATQEVGRADTAVKDAVPTALTDDADEAQPVPVGRRRTRRCR